MFIAMKLAEGQSIRFFFFFFSSSILLSSFSSIPNTQERIAPPCVARRVLQQQQQPKKKKKETKSIGIENIIIIIIIKVFPLGDIVKILLKNRSKSIKCYIYIDSLSLSFWLLKGLDYFSGSIERHPFLPQWIFSTISLSYP